MKKLLLFSCFIIGLLIPGQIIFNSGFEGSTTAPAGWQLTNMTISSSSTNACTGTYSLYKNLYGSTTAATSGSAVYSSTASNGSDLNISFTYKTRPYLSNPIDGTLTVSYSTDGGATYIDLDAINMVSETSCETKNYVVPSLPANANFKFKISLQKGSTSSADFFVGIDDMQLQQVPTTIPNCTTITTPIDGATNVSRTTTISWGVATGATDYILNIGTTPGGSDYLANHSTQGLLSYNILVGNALASNTTYFVSITPTNVIGNATGCATTSFTTLTSPSNDDCSGAISLTVNSDYSCAAFTVGSTVNATNSSPAEINASCASSGTNDDVWFKFVATNDTHRVNLYDAVGTTDLVLAAYSGTCGGGLSAISCSDSPEMLLLSNLNIGEEYYIRVWTYTSTATSYATSFKICVGTPPPPPANDECTDAVVLTPSSNLTCATSVSGTTLSATDSGDAVSPCTGKPDDDVWYQFVASSESHVVMLSNIVSVGLTSSTSLYTQIFEGTCGSMNSIACGTSATTQANNLIIGQTYFVRVYNSNTNTATTNYANTFNICIGTPPPPPVNDECTNAVVLTPSSDLTCATPVSGTTLSATDSGDAASPCTGKPDDDVWYQFVASSESHVVMLSNIVSVGSSSSTSLYTQVFEGICGSMNSIACGTSATTQANNLIIGQTYYVRVYNFNTNTATSSYANTFNICIGTPPPPPTNDTCGGAITLTVNSDYSCGAFTVGTTAYATNSSLAELNASCASSGTNDDVWFKFVATNNTHRVNLYDAVGTTDLVLAAYSGTCGGGLSALSCSDTPEMLLLSNLNIGEEYYIRVWTYSTSATSYATSFKICVGTPPPPPVNDECTDAIVLTPSTSGECSTPVSGTTASATASSETAPTCNPTGINDDVWYQFTATSTVHFVNVNYTDNATSTQVYSGSCGSLVAIKCFSGNYTNSNLLLDSLTIGETYYVRVYSTTNIASTTSNFTICITTPVVPTNDTCNTAIDIPCGGTVTGNNALATNETLPSSTCGSTGTTASYKGVWYRVTAAADGPITVSACGSGFDGYLRVYTGSCAGLTCISNTSGVGYADGGCSGSSNSPTVTFPSTTGTVYYILFTGYNDSQMGEYTLSVTQDCSSMGTTEIISKKDISVYPNPFNDVLNISDTKNVNSITIIDISGRIVKNNLSPEKSLYLEDLKSGTYIVILNMKDGTRQSIKAIKK